MSDNLTKAAKLIDEIYSTWKVIYTDDQGDHRLPTSKKAIKKSRAILTELKSLNVTDPVYQEEIEEIEEILKRATKRKFNFSIKIFIAMILWLGLIIIQNDIHKKPGFRVLELNKEQLLNKKKKSLEVVKRNLESNKKIINSGYENFLKDRDITEKKKKKLWKRRLNRIPKNEKYIKDVTPLSAEEFRKYYIKDEIKDRNKYIRTVIAYIVFFLLYLYVSRRPNFLYWRKGADKDTFSKLENAVGGGIASAAFTSLYTIPSATFEKIHWSNGLVTKRTSMFGANIFVFVLILFFLFCYYILVAVTVPIRVIVNYLRNFVFYI